MHYIDNAVKRLDANGAANVTSDDNEKSVLEKLLLIDRRIAIVMAFDMILAGVDTVSINFSITRKHLNTIYIF